MKTPKIPPAKMFPNISGSAVKIKPDSMKHEKSESMSERKKERKMGMD